MTIYPYTYLLVPFSIVDNSLSFFKDYLSSCNQKECSKWRHAKVTSISEQPVFREAAYYVHLKPFFNAFIGEKPLSDCVVLDLKEKTPYCNESLSFENDANSFVFSIQYQENSFDTIKLIVNLQTKVGLLVIPIKTKVPVNEYQDFLYTVRYTNIPIKMKKDEKKWTLNEKVEELMGDFREHYQKFNEYYAQHLTYIFFDQDVIDDGNETILAGITRCKKRDMIGSDTTCASMKISNTVLIGAATEGVTIMTALKLKKEKAERRKQKHEYALEQSERYMITMMTIFERYLLLHVISNLSKIYTHNDPKGNLRGIVEIVSRTKTKNHFTSISVFPEYNEFYRLCSSSFEIDILYKEVEQKMSSLNSHLTQISNEKREEAEELKKKADWTLSILLAILTVTQSMGAVSQMTGEMITKEMPWLSIIVVASGVVMIAFLYFAVIRKLHRLFN